MSSDQFKIGPNEERILAALNHKAFVTKRTFPESAEPYMTIVELAQNLKASHRNIYHSVCRLLRKDLIREYPSMRRRKKLFGSKTLPLVPKERVEEITKVLLRQIVKAS